MSEERVYQDDIIIVEEIPFDEKETLELADILAVDAEEREKVLEAAERLETLQDGDEAILSKLRRKLVSRKLMVWITATVFFCLDMITEDTWQLFSLLWMGAQSSLDFLRMWRETSK